MKEFLLNFVKKYFHFQQRRDVIQSRGIMGAQLNAYPETSHILLGNMILKSLKGSLHLVPLFQRLYIDGGPVPTKDLQNPPSPQKWPPLHDRCAMCWNEWKIRFQIFTIFIFSVIGHQRYNRSATKKNRMRIDLTMNF